MIKVKVENAIEETWMSAFSTVTNSKSKEKTNILHGIGNIIHSMILNNITESNQHRIETNMEDGGECKGRMGVEDSRGKKINIDGKILLDGVLLNAYLFKAPLVSINKNACNLFENAGGQIPRFYSKTNENKHLTFFNIVPEKTFVFNDKRGSSTVEKVNHYSIKKSLCESVAYSSDILKQIHEVTIRYTTNIPLESINTKGELVKWLANNKLAVSVTNINDLVKYIDNISVVITEKCDTINYKG